MKHQKKHLISFRKHKIKVFKSGNTIFISGELDRVFANRIKVANIQNEYSNRLDEDYSDLFL